MTCSGSVHLGLGSFLIIFFVLSSHLVLVRVLGLVVNLAFDVINLPLLL